MQEAVNMQRDALEYLARGWSILPMKLKEKRPAVKWKRYQAERPSKTAVENWFAYPGRGVGVVFGEVSGGIVSRDFDSEGAYLTWAKSHPSLALELPTVATSRGRHVYAVAAPESVAAARASVGKPDGTGAITLADGELRAGVGCYSVLPPSVHPSGFCYQWLTPLPAGRLPEVEVCEAGFLDSVPDESAAPLREGEASENGCDREHGEDGEYRGRQSLQKQTEAILLRKLRRDENLSHVDADGIHWSAAIQRAILDAVPERIGVRHKQVFELARGLKAVPELADAPVATLRPYVKKWHKLAAPNIGTKPFEESWIDFHKAWPNVRYPKGNEPMKLIFERACSTPAPEIANTYEQTPFRILVALCRELQRQSGDRPFYLACRTAGQLLGVDHSTANRWLYLLQADGVLEVTQEADRARRMAHRYRYLGPL